jgi:hypothetical protein
MLLVKIDSLHQNIAWNMEDKKPSLNSKELVMIVAFLHSSYSLRRILSPPKNGRTDPVRGADHVIVRVWRFRWVRRFCEMAHGKDPSVPMGRLMPNTRGFPNREFRVIW